MERQAYNACFCLASAQRLFLLIFWLDLADIKQSEIQNPSDHQRSTKQSWNGTKYYLMSGSKVRDSTSAVEASISDKPYILEGREVGTVWRVEVGVDYSDVALQWKWKEYHILLDITAKYVLEILEIG
ncbi:hypothetical protein Q3G72_013493 [Acer saccharum]|nr:hypothetical protein Q3G72_013493 [Acer saccharum]